MPRLTSRLATMLETMSTSAKVIRRPVAGKTIASRSGYFAALFSSRLARLYVADTWPPSRRWCRQPTQPPSARREDPGRSPEIGAHGAHRQRAERQTHGAQDVDPEQVGDAAAARGVVEGQAQVGPDEPPRAGLRPQARPVQLRGAHPRLDPWLGLVDPGLADPRLAVDGGDAGQRRLPLRPVPRVDEVVEG